MPPTGLTLFVHGTVIVLKAITKRLHLPFCAKSYAPEGTTKQFISSMMIIAFILFYISAIIFGFVSMALRDDHATWKIIVGEVRELKIQSSLDSSHRNENISSPPTFLVVSNQPLASPPNLVSEL